MLLTITIWIPFYDRVMVSFLAKFTHEPRGLNLKTRMGVGIILSIITMVVSAIVETIRHDLANSNTTVVMSEMWLSCHDGYYFLYPSSSSIFFLSKFQTHRSTMIPPVVKLLKITSEIFSFNFYYRFAEFKGCDYKNFKGCA
ncbi:putative proton-dependent oligopeptide transporter family [Helianthus annuus]|uniref:Proton-dependent oligopeptide transporter family n=1 Tax=Helianthus annuus TaxID=4232 RepID=A0A9K3JZ08_HELAN|nr:putative proton-dependent oligopeptide transporter family [Helianthus annuus]KAJ0624888.1 putative proton-dependent oligopeptide transporter family [Helianthus annuus]KAJ0628554.1 putative proton-dependent oligopeptide transporter family, MFS transporter superfamily [Helianthus annuus]KAJ0784887.1 putative proton-dependent oligopeptide transporter family, MFS transporter superfamily [Helianthus annuus]KAJ0949957.1 putative proton-dependent oligopeptide transporter family [Helianthus annuus]